MKYLVLLLFFTSTLSTGLFSQSFDLVWETKKVLKTPESVLYDENRDQIYVSNINGKPTVKDNNGFISLLRTDGSIRKLKWIGGMNAPKGMALIDSLLFVTDIDRIHVIDISQGKIVKTVEVKDASFLNDMVAISSTNIIVSDMANNHLLIFDGNHAVVWLEDNLLVSPNGLAFFKEALYVGTKDNLLKIDPAVKKIKIHITETGPIDGLIPIGGNKFVISDWSGRILIAAPSDKIVLQNTTDQNIQAADLGFIPDAKIVLIPTFYDNRVVARKLP
jgi:DNA-binding beta-propeller fold protein YncE